MAKAKPQSIDWQNRIVEYGQQSADQFLAHDLNARRHPNAQRDALRGSLNAVGWIAPVIVSQRSGKLLDGHARIEEALSRSESALVPYVLVDVSEAEEAIILGTFDPITGMATYDREVLDALLREIETNDAGLQNLLEELAAKNDLYLTDDAAKPSAGGDDFDTTPEETQTRVRYGDLWQCGEHRVLCGDSTKADDVARVMDGEKTPLTITDPPYNIAQDTEVYGQSASKSLKKLAEAEWDFDFNPELFLNTTLSFHQKDCWIYVFTAHHLFGQIVDWINKNHDKSSFGVWCKPNPMPSLAKNTWTFSTELVCLGRSGKPVFNYPDGEHCLNWWPINKSSDGTHPTQKPIELIEHIIEKCSKRGDLVADFFGGSGTTLIACERTNRKARVIEIEPKYVNVILSRWEAETGREAKLLERIDG